MIKAIIFDCFGVIYPDTLSLVERPYTNNRPEASEQIRELRLMCDKGLVDREEFWDGVARILNISRDTLDQDLSKVQKADWELLEYIKSLRPKYKTAMLSNVGRGFIERIFSTNKPQGDYFDEVMVSGDTKFVKPDPRAYNAATERLGVLPAEAVFVDDSQTNVDGALSVGMRAFLYKDFEQCKRELDQLLSQA